MIYNNIEEYLSKNNYFNEKVNELWIVDNVAIKKFEADKIFRDKNKPQILNIFEIIDILVNKLSNNKNLINKYEQKSIIHKIITSKDYIDIFSNLLSSIDNIVDAINKINSFPSYKKVYSLLDKENNEGIFLLKEKLEILNKLYKEYCEKNNFIDSNELNSYLLEENLFSFEFFDKIVIYGEFFYIPENEMNILANIVLKNSNNISFIGSISDKLEKFILNKDFFAYKKDLFDFFYTSNENSLYNTVKDINTNNIELWNFSDWDDEINYIAREIKIDVLNNNLSFNDIAIFIPENNLYFYKIQKIFKDFNLPILSTYANTLNLHPISNFLKWVLKLDINETHNFFKLLRSVFTNITFKDFKIEKNIDINFLGKIISSNLLEEEDFNLDWIESILIEANINNIYFINENLKKLELFFERKIHFESKRTSDKSNKLEKKLELDFAKAYFYLLYLKEKLDLIISLRPKNGYINQFCSSIIKLFSFLNIDKNYIEQDKYVTENNLYSIFENALLFVSKSISKTNNREYNLDEFIDIYLSYSNNIYILDKTIQDGVLVTEQAFISKMNFKKIYQVGMTNKYFPTKSSKNIFNKFIEKFNPIEVRDVQLFTLIELIKKTKDGLKLFLSYPLVINNQEDEPSEAFYDIFNYLKPESRFFSPKNYIISDSYSNTDEAYLSSKNKIDLSEKNQKLLEHIENREYSNNWSEYDGFLEQENSLNKNTSITKIEEYALCPMKYFFNVELGLKADKKLDKDLEKNIKGNIVHKILEDFYVEATKLDFFKNKDLLSKESKDLMLSIANNNLKTYEESLNNSYIDKMKELLVEGLDTKKESEFKGVLLEVLEIDQKRMLKGIIPSKFEENFEYNFQGLNFIGIIDRIDEHENSNFFDVIDYKTGKIDATEKKLQIKEGLSYQLPIYSLGYMKKSNKEINKGFYYSLKKNSFFDEISLDSALEDDFQGSELEKDMKTIIKENLGHLKKLKEKLSKSEYNYTLYPPEDTCKYCDYKNICRFNLEKSEANNIKVQELNILNTNFIEKDLFYFPNKLDKTDKPSKLEITIDQQKALSTDRNIIVTAGAGAGKTKTLTDRMNELLIATKGDIEKILVITFTKKATAEMQNRIYDSLLNNNSQNIDAKEYIQKAKTNFKNNWISTIDSFYLRILQENALELDIDCNINISDYLQINELESDTIEKTLDDLAYQKDKSLNNLLESWDRKTLIENFSYLVNSKGIDYYINNSFENIKEKYVDTYILQAKHLKNHIKNFSKKIPLSSATQDPRVKSYLVNVEEIIAFYLENLDKAIKDPVLFECKFGDLRVPNKPRNKPELDDIAQEIKEELALNLKTKNSITFSFLSSVSVLGLELNHLYDLIEIIKKIKNNYDKIKKERNIYNFNDISDKLYYLLKNNPEVRKKLSNKFDFIMIDEFQDTSLEQYEIAKFLAGWDGKTLESINKNKLFFVGDEKQSIYQFRGGDVQVFNQAKKELFDINALNNLDNKHLVFPDNFRSSENLVNFFNSFFYNVFSNSENKKVYEAEHQNLTPHKKDGSVNFFFVNIGDKKSKKTRKNHNLEAKLISSTIKKILSYNPNEEIAILFRTGKKINRFANALEKAGINYIIYGGRGFYDSQEILDIIHILKFLSDKKKILELVGFLRSSFIGMSDKEIYNIKDNFIKGLENNYPQIYSSIFGLYDNNKLIKKGWKQLICDLKVYELIEVIIQETFVKLPLFKGKNSKQKIKNIERFIEIAKDKESYTLEEFIEFIDFQISNKINESNASILEIGEQKPVQLMTIHKSKGLGFDTVILADTASESFKPYTESIVLNDLELFYDNQIFKNFIGFNPKNYKYSSSSFIRKTILEHIKQKDEAELKRLLYVAMTRAKHNLIISASVYSNLESLNGTMAKLFSDFFTFEIISENESKSVSPMKDFVLYDEDFLDVESNNIPFFFVNKSYDIDLDNV